MKSRIEKKSLGNLVYEVLKKKILNNELLPGDKLIEMDIASELGVSRTPVREALARLEKEGLAKNFPRKSYIVSKISMKEAKNLYTVRAALEPLALELLAEGGFNKRTKKLEEVLVSMDRAYETKDFDSLQNLIVDWNVAMVNSLKNDILREIMQLINERLYRFGSFIFRDENNIVIIYKLIKQLCDYVERREVALAKETSKKLIDSIYPMLEEQSDFRMFRY